MANHIIKQLEREVAHAFHNGLDSLTAFGKRFLIDHVTSDEYRLTDEAGNDIGLRFTVDRNKYLDFCLA